MTLYAAFFVVGLVSTILGGYWGAYLERRGARALERRKRLDEARAQRIVELAADMAMSRGVTIDETTRALERALRAGPSS